MKKFICALVCGLMLVPLSAWGQKWIEPHTDKDGTQVEGHWQTPEDVRQEQYSTPGKINPYTGQFNPYSGSGKGPQSVTPPPANSSPMKGNPYYSIPDYRYQGRQAVLEREVYEDNYVLIIGRVQCAEINDRYSQENKFLQSPILLLSPQLLSLGDKLADPAEFTQVMAELKY